MFKGKINYQVTSKCKLIIVCFAFLFGPLSSWAHKVSNTASTTIIAPKQGAKVKSPVLLKFQTKGFKIGPAGKDIHRSGHYHLLINQDLNDWQEALPKSSYYTSLEQGQSQLRLTLKPGKYRFQVVVADEEHEVFEPLISKIIEFEIIK